MSHPYISSLIKACQAAMSAEPVRVYHISSMEQLESVPSKGSFVYIIREVNGVCEKTHKEFSNFRKISKYACARLNPEPSEVLYVGSSTTNLRSRLKQHIDSDHPQTYALHMSKWFQGEYQVEICEFNVPIEVLQLIEDSMSFNLKPAFGKQGGNNKSGFGRR